MASTIEERKAFVARLTQACDENPHIPPAGQGRGQVLAERLRLAPEAVSKWFKGVSMPRLSKMRELADLLAVEPEWLHFGTKPDMTRRERRVYARESDGAMHLVWGLIALSGGHCGLPAPNDPRGEYVDFFAMIGGTAYPIRVTLAREIAPEKFEVVIPKEFREVRMIAVVPGEGGKFYFLDMPADGIDEHKVLKRGDFVVQLDRVSNTRYTSGNTHWPRIITFGEFVEV